MTGADRETDMTRNSPEGNARRCFSNKGANRKPADYQEPFDSQDRVYYYPVFD